jgi:uncharacterized protein YecT (DUF1311 family)
MFKPFLLMLICSLCLILAACQQVQETTNDTEQLSTPNSPLTNPTKNEVDASKTACDDAANDQEAEQCAKIEFEKTDTEMNDSYQKFLANLRKFEEKAGPQDKILADKYRKDRQNLEAAQKAWLAFREANCTAEKGVYGENQNAAFAAFSCQERMTADRLEDLKTIYENK